MPGPADENWETYRREDFTRFSVTYLRHLPDGGDGEPTVSESHSLGFSFRRHADAVVQLPNGRTATRSHGALTGAANADGALRWLRVHEPVECIEIRPDAALRAEIAETVGTADARDFLDLTAQDNTVLRAVSLRLRAHLSGGLPLEALEADELIRTLLVDLGINWFGGREPRRNTHRLDGARLARIDEYLHERAGRVVGNDELAGLVHMSAYHFLRAFRRTTGLSPHRYATALRMERAFDALERGFTMDEAARAAGFAAPGHGFRTQLRRWRG